MAQKKARAPLLPGISQHHVDFVVPRLGLDLPLGIDPFLLYKSRDPKLHELHQILLRAFQYGFELIREGRYTAAQNLFSFPEVAELGLGYTKQGKRGSGIGSVLSELIVQTVARAPRLLQRGLRHIEE